MNRLPDTLRLLLLCGGLLTLLACRSSSFGIVDRTNASEHLAIAEADLASGRSETAFARLQKVWEVTNLEPELRLETERLIGEAAPLAASGGVSGSRLLDMADLNLPRRMRIELWVQGARRMLEDGERMKAFRAVRDLEEAYPMHYLREEAANVVAEAGLSLAEDDGRYALFFPYRDKAPQVLEFLVLTFPFSDHCAEAYFTLGDLYERKGDWQLAIERHQELLRYHLDSSFALYSEARIPYLRMRKVKSPEYDRQEMQVAKAELMAWLERHPGDELTGSVGEMLVECRGRLVDNDLFVARFYDEIENAYGARYHAERALEEARGMGDPERVARCEDMLAHLPETDGVIDPSRFQGPDIDTPTDTGFGVGVEEASE